MDTIIRGLPIPPIFLRQKTDINTKSTYREIIDGQQRVRTIIEYISDESFSILPSFNKEYGGKLYTIVKENPYRIAEDISGVGFKTADEIVGIYDTSTLNGLMEALKQRKDDSE